MKRSTFPRDLQFYKFSTYGFLKNLKFFDPFIILFFKEMGLSFFQIGILFAIREVATNFLEMPTGIVADSFGRRSSMIFSFISYIISFIIFYLFPFFWIYAIAMIFFAFGEAFRTGTHKAMILEYLKIKNLTQHKVDYYGHTRAASQLGAALSSIIAAVLVFYSGSYKIIFLASTIPYILDLLLMISYPKELDGEIIKHEGQTALIRIFSQIHTTIKNFLSIFANKDSLRAIINSSLFDGMYKTVKDYLQPILKNYAILIPIFIYLDKDKRISIVIGLVYFALYILNSFSSSSAGKFSKKIKSLGIAININYLAGATIIMISGIALYFKLYIISILFFIFLNMIENLKRPMTVGYISELISNKVMATGLSSESQFKAIFVAIFSVVMGLLADKIGVGAGLVAMSVILLMFYPIIALKKD